MLPHLLYSPFLFFSSVWDYVPVRFLNARRVAASRAFDVSVSNDARRSCRPKSTRSSSGAHELNGAVDRVSETSDASD